MTGKSGQVWANLLCHLFQLYGKENTRLAVHGHLKTLCAHHVRTEQIGTAMNPACLAWFCLIIPCLMSLTWKRERDRQEGDQALFQLGCLLHKAA